LSIPKEAIENPTTHSLVAYTTNSWESPLATLRLVGPASEAGARLLHGANPGQINPELVEQADVVVIQRDFPRHVDETAQVITRARAGGKPVLFDLDDLLLELPEDNPDRLSHYYSEALFPMFDAICQADAVTTSTPTLASYLLPYNPRVLLLPNYLNDHLWTLSSPHKRDANSAVVVGYMGGPSHLPDLLAVTSALINIARRYGERVLIRFLGAEPPPELQRLPNVAWVPAKTYHYAVFAADFVRQDYDIAFAPLKDNLFNRCKSHIKFLEYSAAGIPGVYSNLETYNGVVRTGQNGYLADGLDEWEEYLSRLVEDPDLRYEIAYQAQETVRRDWLLSEHAQVFQQAWFGGQPQEPTRVKKPSPQIDLALNLSAQVQSWQTQLQVTNQRLEVRVEELNQTQLNLQRQLGEKDDTIEWLNHLLYAANRRIQDIENSHSWKFTQRVLKARRWLIPEGSRRETIFHLGLRLLIKPSQAAPNPNEGNPPLVKLPSAVTENKPEATPSISTITPALGIERIPAQAMFDGPGKFAVIVLPVMGWGTRTQRPQQIVRRFAAEGYRVFYVQTTFTRGDSAQIHQVQDYVFEVMLPAPGPVNIYQDSMDAASVQTFQQAWNTLRQDFNIFDAVCMVDLPFWTPLALGLRQAFGWKIVYDCMDTHKGFSTNSPQMLEQEDELTLKSDLVLATSSLLFSEKSRQNPNCLRLPNGADFDHFHFPPIELPPGLKLPGRPLIGYYGAIADWFDTGQVSSLALARPDWDFVLIGSTLFADLSPIKSLANVKLLGEIPYADLPQFLHAFDVAIIPFKQMPLTQATNPVKLFEYLSAGKPTVATDLSELHAYQDYIYLASTPQEWVDAIEACLAEDFPQLVQKRTDFARQNTWQRRFEQLEPRLVSLFPRASIIILTYNNLDFSRYCLESIFQKTTYPNYEVIVVDNASIDGTPDYLKSMAAAHPNLKLILNSTNAGFARGNNQGAALATGDILVFLNNDTIVTRDWLSGLVRHVQDPTIGMVGPVTNFSGNESRIPVTYHSIDEMDEFAYAYVRAHPNQTLEMRTLAFYCVAMRRSIFEEIGPLDEIFGIGMFEDDDYALRLKNKGYRVVCAEDVFVHHWGRSSFSKLDQQKYQALFDENRQKFEQKWNITWTPHQYRQAETTSNHKEQNASDA
jgi:GT2 family glycosyltransferase/glycosyltransferase involved in cell wall biosynthesis